MKIFLPVYGKTFYLTDEQEKLVDMAVCSLKSGDMLFQYAAPAGCGKSIVLHVIINELGLKEEEVAPMAYMGSAAMIMRKNGFSNAKTCHSWLYQAVERKKNVKGKTLTVTDFIPKSLPREIRLVVIDEGSMVPYEIRQEIESRSIPVLVCGDLDQLQPVESKSAYLTTGRVERLTKIMRQTEHSSIVYLSNLLREGEEIKPGNYGEVLVLEHEDLTDEMLLKAEAIICGFNNTRDRLTYRIRHDLLRIKEKVPIDGEKLVCRQNNWDIEKEGINLVNGMIGYCLKGPSISSITSNNTFFMDFQPSLFPDIKFEHLECDYDYFLADHRRRKMIKMFQPKFRRKLNKFEFGLTVTAPSPLTN